MSYDLHFYAPDGSPLELDAPLDVRGGTFALGGTTAPWLNITYNYGEYLRELFGDKGIRELYEKSAHQITIDVAMALVRISEVGRKIEPQPCGCHQRLDCYWAVTTENVRACLHNLLTLAQAVPSNSILRGD